jgi:hypothetical protein
LRAVVGITKQNHSIISKVFSLFSSLSRYFNILSGILSELIVFLCSINLSKGVRYAYYNLSCTVINLTFTYYSLLIEDVKDTHLSRMTDISAEENSGTHSVWRLKGSNPTTDYHPVTSKQ